MNKSINRTSHPHPSRAVWVQGREERKCDLGDKKADEVN